MIYALGVECSNDFVNENLRCGKPKKNTERNERKKRGKKLNKKAHVKIMLQTLNVMVNCVACDHK